MIKFKALNDKAVLPVRANSTDAGMDIVCTSINETDMFIEYGTSLAVAIPPGHAGFLFPRSSVTNKDLMLKNSIGCVDNLYRGEIKARFAFTNRDNTDFKKYEIGERCCQLLIVPINLDPPVFVDELDETVRGDGSFGSTGK